MNRKRLLNFLGVVLIAAGFALMVLTLLMQLNRFSERYQEILRILADFEQSVADIPNKGLIVIAILLIYLSKSIIPIPLSAVCVIAGMVFPTPLAIAINTAGFFVLVTIKYFWGKHLGRGVVYKMLARFENIQQILDSDSTAKDGLLIGFRLVPIVPVNTVSQLYGAMNFSFLKYSLFSVTGFLPRIISFAMVGRHVYDPFSLAFMVPIVILVEISGVAMLGINAFIELYNKKIKSY